MGLFDFLAQAGFWQWMGFLHMCWIGCIAVTHFGPLTITKLIETVRGEKKP